MVTRGRSQYRLLSARGLLKHKNIKIRIYEARPEIGHDGTGVGIGANGQNALGLVDPELFKCLLNAGAVENVPSVRFMMATGLSSGEKVAEVFSEPPQRTVMRSRFLTEIKSLVPDETLKTGKRLLSIAQQSNKVLLTFEDGDEVTVDAVVGGDGINSIVRRYVLGEDNPSTETTWSKGVRTRMVVPMSEAIPIFGQEYCSYSTQIGWIGDGGFSLTDTQDDGNSMQIVTGFSSQEAVPEVYGKPYVAVEKYFWTSRLQDWGWIGEKITQVIQGQDKCFAVGGRNHDETPYFSNGRLAVCGDASGAFPAFLGAGAGQAIEDALILCTVLGCAEEANQIEKAFHVYDHLRRPRRQAVANMSRQQAVLLTGQEEGVGTDIEKLSNAVTGRYEELYVYDLSEAVEEARRLMSVTHGGN